VERQKSGTIARNNIDQLQSPSFGASGKVELADRAHIRSLRRSAGWISMKAAVVTTQIHITPVMMSYAFVSLENQRNEKILFGP
jgi:hypothetical protein